MDFPRINELQVRFIHIQNMSIKIPVKPLSVNECWQGRRFKTDEYKAYEKKLLYMLPKIQLPAPPFYVEYTFGVSNMASDLDNPVKPITDILQKKYGFNDSRIHKMVIGKMKVEKGKEYIEFSITHYLGEI